MKHLYEIIKSFITNDSQHMWLENHFIYFSVILGGLTIIIVAFIINMKISKSIKKMDIESKRRKVQSMRDLSKAGMKKKESETRLVFDDEDNN